MLTLTDIERALRTPAAEQDMGDHRIGRNGTKIDAMDTPTPAGVLVPLVERRGGLNVVLTKRSSALKRHAGQVSFPGGRRDPEDPDLTATALREAEEEIGLPRHDVSVLGPLPLYRTGTGFQITPVVGVIPATFSPVPETGEVEEVFEVGLDILMDPANHSLESAVWNGRKRDYYVLPHDRHTIWGATAGILVGLSQRIWLR
ncbi:MAG: CoA pyrophosphatase [Pseudomonadota bacterium]